MKNIKLIIEFDGTDFCGSQVQTRGRTVQGEMEQAIETVTGQQLRIIGCSRTDSGVHGRNYVLNFKCETTIPPDRFLYPLNDVLPPDIRVKASSEAPLDFHSRKDAISKTYSYTFRSGRVEFPLTSRYESLEKLDPSYEKMKEAASGFLGTHDFKAFRSTGSSVQSTVRTIHHIDIQEADGRFILTITGNGFLYNMVRIIAGTLIEIGAGLRSIDDIQGAFQTLERSKAGKVAPAKGLVLESIEY